MDDKAKNSYLLRKYGRSLEWYNEELRRNGGGCAICGKPPGKRAFHVDHDHSYRYVKIEYTRQDGTLYGYKGKVWFGVANYRGMDFTDAGVLKSNVTRSIRSALKYYSVRGLLCWPCNRALQAFRDRPDLMMKASCYLVKFQYPTAV